MCPNWEINGITDAGIVGSSPACFPIDGMRLLSMLFIADIFVRPNAAPLYLSPHIPELSLAQGKSTAITNNKIRGNALFDFFQMIEKGHWNRYITVASCGLGHIGNLRTIVAENTCTRIPTRCVGDTEHSFGKRALANPSKIGYTSPCGAEFFRSVGGCFTCSGCEERQLLTTAAVLFCTLIVTYLGRYINWQNRQIYLCKYVQFVYLRRYLFVLP